MDRKYEKLDLEVIKVDDLDHTMEYEPPIDHHLIYQINNP